MKFTKVVLVSVVSLQSCFALAGEQMLAHPLSSGMVFPSMADSVLSNPAAIADDKASVARLDYVPALAAIPNGSFAGTLATSQGKWGLGAQITALSMGAFALGNGTVAAGLNLSGLSLGANATFNLNNLSAMDLGAGLTIGKMRGFRVAATVSSLQALETSGMLSVGMGYAQHTYQLELNFSRPLATIPMLTNNVSAGTAFYFGKLGLGINGGFQTTSLSDLTPASFSYGASALLSFGRNVGFDARYAVSGALNTLSLGLTYSF